MIAARSKPNHFIGASVLMTVLATIAAVGVLALLIGVGANPAEAAPQGAKGKIAFASDRAGNFDIWVMNDDGSNPVQLTNNPLPELFPAWSPDGQKIAFTRGDRAGAEIFVINADGQPQQLTDNQVGDSAPTWSPDGQKIAFRRNLVPGDLGSSEIFVMDSDGSGQTNLTNDPAEKPAFDFGPDWSPDGKQIAFSSDRGGAAPFAMTAIYTMRPDGTRIRKLTDDSLQAFSPAWSPGGDKLAFSDHAIHGESDLFVMKADGTGVTQLFETPENETGATWSPDGKRIAFERFEVTGNEKRLVPNSGEIYVVGTDGKGLKNLTNSPGSNDENPHWSPEQDD